MKNIYMLVCLLGLVYPALITFNVDMSEEDLGEEYPTLWMGYFYPDAGFAMTDSDGDNVWTITLSLDPGTYTYKYRNGAWTDWNTGSGWESVLGQDCAVGDWSDREVIVGSADMILETVCFSSCSSECINLNYYDVTFQVDMNNVDEFDPTEGVYVQGTLNGWCGYCNPMSDENGDFIYSLTINLPESSYEYIFTTNGWNGLEGYAPLNSSCDYIQGDYFANYGFDLSSEDIVLDIVPFGECPDGDTGQSSLVLFDIDGIDNCDFVSISGTFDDWSGWGATSDTDMQTQVPLGDHEFQILCVDTNIPEWYNDIWSASTILSAPLGSECDWDDTDDFANYGFSVINNMNLTISICASTCDEVCEESCPELGDVNNDGLFNVLDIVSLANCVLSESCENDSNSCAADMNDDGQWNVLDIVNLASCVIAESCGD